MVHRRSDPTTWVWVDGDPFDVGVFDFVPLRSTGWHDGYSITIYRQSELVIQIYDYHYDYVKRAFVCEIDCDNIGKALYL